MSEDDEPVSAAGPQFEVVDKTPQEYRASLAAHGKMVTVRSRTTKKEKTVLKVCNKKYRPAGSDEPFVLCESAEGLSANSACGHCRKTRKGVAIKGGNPNSRSRCKCARLGVPCLHSSGNNAKGNNPLHMCARCRDGKCDDAYHQSKKAKHFREA